MRRREFRRSCNFHNTLLDEVFQKVQTFFSPESRPMHSGALCFATAAVLSSPKRLCMDALSSGYVAERTHWPENPQRHASSNLSFNANGFYLRNRNRFCMTVQKYSQPVSFGLNEDVH